MAARFLSFCFVAVAVPTEAARRLSTSGMRSTKSDASWRSHGEYKVLTYNICWGCMEGDANDGTGMKADLKEKCMQYTDQAGSTDANGMGMTATRCADNIGQQVARLQGASGGYDLMAFQEASNFGDLQLPQRNVHLHKIEWGANLEGIVHSKGIHKGEQKKAWVVSLFNKERFGKVDVALHSALQDDSGRPYLILVFDSHKLMFINLHNTQPGKKVKRHSWDHFAEEMNELLGRSFSEQPERRNYRVILAGDFNDLSGSLPGNVLMPWNNATMKLKEPLAKSCCSSKMGKEPKHGGDYIFDSAGPVVNRIPKGYNSNNPQSDHWPVEAYLSGETHHQEAPKVQKKQWAPPQQNLSGALKPASQWHGKSVFELPQVQGHAKPPLPPSHGHSPKGKRSRPKPRPTPRPMAAAKVAKTDEATEERIGVLIQWMSKPDLCMAAPGAPDAATAYISLAFAKCNASSQEQLFNLPATSGSIKWSGNPNFCLDVDLGGTHDGITKVILYPCSQWKKHPNQLFIAPLYTGPIHWKSQPDKCFDAGVVGSDGERRITLHSCLKEGKHRNQLFVVLRKRDVNALGKRKSGRRKAMGKIKRRESEKPATLPDLENRKPRHNSMPPIKSVHIKKDMDVPESLWSPPAGEDNEESLSLEKQEKDNEESLGFMDFLFGKKQENNESDVKGNRQTNRKQLAKEKQQKSGKGNNEPDVQFFGPQPEQPQTATDWLEKLQQMGVA